MQSKDVQRLQGLTVQKVSNGRYDYTVQIVPVLRIFVARLQRPSCCFGYGSTEADAFEMMRGNLRMFASDAGAAQLVRMT